VLFDDLGPTATKRTKTGFSTDAQSLEKLRGEHPIVDHLLGYREVEKLRSTYGVGLLAEVGADEAEFSVDPLILGGLIVRWPGGMVDGSVRSQLNEMARSLS